MSIDGYGEYDRLLSHSLIGLCLGHGLTSSDCYLLLELTRPGLTPERQKDIYIRVAGHCPEISDLLPYYSWSGVDSNKIKRGPLVVNIQTHGVTIEGELEVKLSLTEFRLLYSLVLSPGQPFSWRELIEGIWGCPVDYINPSTLGGYIKRIREKIEPDPSDPRFLVGRNPYGYRFLVRDHEYNKKCDQLFHNSLKCVSKGSLTSLDWYVVYELTKPFIPLQQQAKTYEEAVASFPGIKKLVPFCFSRLGPHTIKRRGLIIDDQAFEVAIDGKEIELSPIEFRILHHLSLSVNQVISSEQLKRKIWTHSSNATKNTVARYISRLRRKIEPYPSDPRFLVGNVRYGYEIHLPE